ncbi:MAG: hypothetical protein M5R42_09410 [Rhodocyclaceae bacterium]|nr:hypothetical protein [Rhodocyclaceae bacterium]
MRDEALPEDVFSVNRLKRANRSPSPNFSNDVTRVIISHEIGANRVEDAGAELSYSEARRQGVTRRHVKMIEHNLPCEHRWATHLNRGMPLSIWWRKAISGLIHALDKFGPECADSDPSATQGGSVINIERGLSRTSHCIIRLLAHVVKELTSVLARRGASEAAQCAQTWKR